MAHVQYYGWALLQPRRADADPRAARGGDRDRRARRAASCAGRLAIDYVIPDYWAKRPKPCMGGWGSTILNVTPQGKVMPCHAAASIPGLEFASVRDRPLRWIWQESPAFQRFRGTDWMPEPCRSCALKEVDFGGCRCQAMALTGDATRDRPGLRAVAAARGHVHGRASRVGCGATALRLPTPAAGGPGALDDSAGGGRNRRLTEDLRSAWNTPTDGSHASTVAGTSGKC